MSRDHDKIIKMPKIEENEVKFRWAGPAKKLRRPEPGYKELQLMQGFPPPECNQVNMDNWMLPPYNRWSYSHVRELIPSRIISKGSGEPSELKLERLHDATVENIEVKDVYDNLLTYGDFLRLTACDGVIVLHKGCIVFEKYFNGYTAEDHHIMMSVTKSIVGTIVMKLISSNKLKGDDLVVDYVPELKFGVYHDKTIQQVLDMQVCLSYSEDYADLGAEVWKYATAMGFANWDSATGGPKSIYEYLPTLKRGTGIEGQFQYSTPNTDVLGWVASRKMGKDLSSLFSEEIYSELGAESDAFWMLDSSGVEAAGGGLNMTLRDAARFGLMVLNKGKVGSRSIMDAQVFDGLVTSANSKKIKKSFAEGKSGNDPGRENWSYHNQWWMTNNDNNAFSAVGVYGQGIYVNPEKEIVIVRQSANTVANDDPLLLSNVQINDDLANKISKILEG